MLDNIGLPASNYDLAFSDGSTVALNDGQILVSLKPGHAPTAFIGLLQGRNFGKLVVRLAADPTRRAWARRQRGGRCPRFDPACPKAACHGVGREFN